METDLAYSITRDGITRRLLLGEELACPRRQVSETTSEVGRYCAYYCLGESVKSDTARPVLLFLAEGRGRRTPANCRPAHVQDGYGVACLPLGLEGLSKTKSVRGTVNCETPQFKQIETSGKTKTPGPVRFSRLETWRSISAGNSARRSEPHDGQGITDSHGRGSSSVNSLTLHPRTRSCKLRRRDWCRHGGGKPAHSGGPLFFSVVGESGHCG